MRCFADEDDTVARKRIRGFHRERKHAAALFDGHLAQQRMGAALDFGRKLGVVRGGELGCAFRIEHAHQAGSLAGQGNQRERAAPGMEFRRRIVMRPRMSQIEHQSGLRISVPRGRDAGGGAAERALPVGADHKPDTHLGIVKLDGDA